MQLAKGYFRRNAKYGNEKPILDGRSFGSKLEAAVYQELRLREKAGDLVFIQQQDHVYLTEARIHYIPDFLCTDPITGINFWVEAKGMETPEWRLKLKLWRFYGPGKLEIYKGSHLRPVLIEVVTPKGEKECA